MMTRFSKYIRFLSVVYLAIWAAGSPTSAQTRPRLDLQLYAGLSVTGAVGTIYSIQYITDLAHTNANDWRCLTFLQLPKTNYLWTDTSAPATGRRFYRAIQFDAPTNMVFIPPGTFTMGSPTNDFTREDSEIPRTAVTISHGFWMGIYLVTQADYLGLMGNNPSYFNGYNFSSRIDYGIDLRRPVEEVNWFDATNYCNRLTQRERVAGRIATNSVYRLPTEAEWEYACRAGTSTRFFYGDDLSPTNLMNYAWYVDNSRNKTHAVGQKLPNPWGLYDMYGNVDTWCQDWYDIYPGGIALDPQGPELDPAAPSSRRVIRGAYWVAQLLICRSASRAANYPPQGDVGIGLRVVLSAGQP